MKLLKLIGGLIVTFLGSIGITFMILSKNAPLPEPKSPEDIVWEFLIKDRSMNPEVLKSQLISYKRNLRDLEDKHTYYETTLDSLYAYYHAIDSIHIAHLLLKASKSRKILDKLKESDLKKYNLEQNRKEQKEIDEIGSKIAHKYKDTK